MTGYDKNISNSLIQYVVLQMASERRKWSVDDVRTHCQVDSSAVGHLFRQLRDLGQCAIIEGTYVTFWTIGSDWFNPRELHIDEMVVVKIADGGGTIRDVVKYYRELGEQYECPVRMGDLLSSRQAAYSRSLKHAGAKPLGHAYVL